MQQRSKPDVHLRVGGRYINDCQVTKTAYTAATILSEISLRLRSLHLDGPREHVDAARTLGGLQHIRLSGGPRHGLFSAWTDEYCDDMARLCFELEWNAGPPAQGGVKAIELESPFYRPHTLCDALDAGGMRKVVVDGSLSHIVVA